MHNASYMITRYHAKYYASLLSSNAVGGDIDSLSQSLLSSTVDINPHQIDAALFAFKSPFNKGVVLADEVGLGKTIEAGLVLCQYWSVGKKKIIVVCPASLRKQWESELQDKFGIKSEILDTKNYNAYIKEGKILAEDDMDRYLQLCRAEGIGNNLEEIMLHYEKEDFREKLA